MKQTFSRKKFQQLIAKCGRILRNNDKLSPESIFDAFAGILFTKIQNEKENGQNATPTPDRFKHEPGTAGVKRVSIERILDELDKFNISGSTGDLIGLAFEELLGTTFRGKLGQFLTPRPIVDFMVRVLDPGENELVCDPCCGTGGFLVEAFRYVKEKTGPDSPARNLFGVDANPRMARTAKMNMIAHGDGRDGCAGVYHHDGLLNVGGVFGNRFDVILTNPPFGARVDRKMTVTGHDLPVEKKEIERLVHEYGGEYRDALERLKKHVGKPLRNLYDLGKTFGQTEVLFLERCLRLLKPGGRMGIVLPEGVLNSDRMQKVRDYAEGRAKLLLVVSLPRDVFCSSGTAAKTSIVFLKKFTEAESRHYGELVRTVTSELDKKENEFDDEIRQEIKKRFNYKILIADVQKAGINRTGGPDENQLPRIAGDFEKYRKTNNLWE